MPRPKFPFHEAHAKTAEDFLDLLAPHRPEGELWSNNPPWANGWIFRGQEDANWKLTPSALRGGHPWSKFKFALAMGATPRAITDPQELAETEEGYVLTFANHVAHLGYEIPFDSAKLRDRDRARKRTKQAHFPPSDYRGIWALAQHYGVPTRLLDWSERPLVSAYFAAMGVAQSAERALKEKKTPSDGNFAVWAVSRWYIETFCGTHNPDVVMVTVPKHTNPNLRAQAGLFTLIRYLRKPTEIPPDLEDLLCNPTHIDAAKKQKVERKVGVWPAMPVLYKLTCPKSEAPFLLHYLAVAGIDASTIYHGHGSVVTAMQESRYRSIVGPNRHGRLSGQPAKPRP